MAGWGLFIHSFYGLSIYLDELLQRLTSLDHDWQPCQPSFCYADDIDLLSFKNSSRVWTPCNKAVNILFSLIDHSKLDLLLNHVFILGHLIQIFLTPSPTLGIVHLKIVQTSREPHLKCAKKRTSLILVSLLVIYKSREFEFSLPLIVYCCTVVLSGHVYNIHHAVNFLPWRLH